MHIIIHFLIFGRPQKPYIKKEKDLFKEVEEFTRNTLGPSASWVDIDYRLELIIYRYGSK